MATTNNPQASAGTAAISLPTFKRVPQQGRHDDTFAVIATIAGKTLQEVFQQAEAFGLPKIGPYYAWIDGDLIAKLLAHYGWVTTVWKECSGVKDLPDLGLAIAMISYDEVFEVGRNVLIVRQKGLDGKVIQYAIDPYLHADAKLHLRTDLAGLEPSWYIGVTPMNKSTAK
jgi:hypothetical protein